MILGNIVFTLPFLTVVLSQQLLVVNISYCHCLPWFALFLFLLCDCRRSVHAGVQLCAPAALSRLPSGAGAECCQVSWFLKHSAACSYLMYTATQAMTIQTFIMFNCNLLRSDLFCCWCHCTIFSFLQNCVDGRRRWLSDVFCRLPLCLSAAVLLPGYICCSPYLYTLGSKYISIHIFIFAVYKYSKSSVYGYGLSYLWYS